MDVLHVCISCRYSAEQRLCEGKRGGLILFEVLESKIKEARIDMEVKPVECLSACRSASALAFTSRHKMSMVFGRLDISAGCDLIASALVDYAKVYNEKADGYILRSDRPAILQDKLIARVPPPEGLAKPRSVP